MKRMLGIGSVRLGKFFSKVSCEHLTRQTRQFIWLPVALSATLLQLSDHPTHIIFEGRQPLPIDSNLGRWLTCGVH
jgi:hypothetical protein